MTLSSTGQAIFQSLASCFSVGSSEPGSQNIVIQKRFIFIARFLVQIGFLFLLAVLVPSVGFYFFFYIVYFACPFYILIK
jgi:hypothetical protein